jgi:hypothetical protein
LGRNRIELWVNDAIAQKAELCLLCNKEIKKGEFYRVVLDNCKRYIFCLNCAKMYMDTFVFKLTKKLRGKKNEKRKKEN